MTELSIGPDTVNRTLPVCPIGVITFTPVAPRVAVVEIAKLVVMVVEFTTVTGPTVMPALPVLTVVVPVVEKFVPVRVTGTVAPRRPAVGLIDANVGPPFTVNVTVLVVRPPEVTVTVCGPKVATVVTLKVAVTVVEFNTTTLETPMPMPDTFTAVVPPMFVPVSVTVTVWPRLANAGEIELSEGVGGVVIA